MNNMSQGKRAVISGRNFKKLVEKSMENHGFISVHYDDYNTNPSTYNRVMIHHEPFINAHGKCSKTGYTLKVSNHEEYRINSMYQDVSGTAIQKVNFVLDSMQKMCDNIFVYSGKAFDDDVVNCINTKAQSLEKNILVLSYEDFLTWLNDKFIRGNYVS